MNQFSIPDPVQSRATRSGCEYDGCDRHAGWDLSILTMWNSSPIVATLALCTIHAAEIAAELDGVAAADTMSESLS